MDHYNARIETARRGPVTVDDIDQLMGDFAGYHPSISVSPYGNVTAHISVPAESLTQATSTAVAVVVHAVGAEAVAVEVTTEAEFDRRQGYVPVPDLISVEDAAEILRVSPQRVRQMISEGKLAAHRIGERTLILTRAEVEAKTSAS